MKLYVFLKKMIKILNVAEKNDVAKSIAAQVSKGTSKMVKVFLKLNKKISNYSILQRNGLSPYNKIYEFEADLFNRRCLMIMTSVSGHLLSLDFPIQYKNWRNIPPVELFSAPVYKTCTPDYEPIKKTIEREIRNCKKLIIWTDCDREGENIGYEIIDVCKAVNPNIDVYRAVFSEITGSAIQRALNNLQRPNNLISDAVDARIELDLRIGKTLY